MRPRLLTATLLFVCCQPPAINGQSLEWIRQFGTSQDDYGHGVSSNGVGRVYVAGETYGTLAGTTPGQDAFVRQFDTSGLQGWTNELDSGIPAAGYSVSANISGQVYLAGYQVSALLAPAAFLRKYDAVGAVEWTRLIDTDGIDVTRAVAADGLGNVYVGGASTGALHGTNAGFYDAFLARYDFVGTLLWSRQLGTIGADLATGVAADASGNIFVVGSTEGALGAGSFGGQDAFVSRYDASGTLLWTRQLGTGAVDAGLGVSSDGFGNVYITGQTEGSLAAPNAGGKDAFLAKYNASGSLIWSRQLGTSGDDEALGISANGLGSIYVAGSTDGSLGANSAGESDVFLVRYSPNGTLLGAHQFGSSDADHGSGVSADGQGHVYLSGWTRGRLGGVNAGGQDVFLAKYVPDGADADFNDDGSMDCADIDSLVMSIVAGTHPSGFDLTGDGLVNQQDLNEWLVQGGAANLPSGNPYLPGDADLSGVVDGSDFVVWNTHKFTSIAAWCRGDFNANGVVDGGDFILWNNNKFMSADGLAAVPEPRSSLLSFLGISLTALMWGRSARGAAGLPARKRGRAAVKATMLMATTSQLDGSGTAADDTADVNLLLFQMRKSEPSTTPSAVKSPEHQAAVAVNLVSQVFYTLVTNR